MIPLTLTLTRTHTLIPPHLHRHPTPSNSVVTIDLQNKRLRALAAALSPAYLRVGGSEGDNAVYDIPAGTCATAKADPAFCLSAARWEELTSFCADTGLDLAFGINIMYGRGADGKGPWDPSNMRALLEYTAAHNITVGGFEMGNEKEEVLTPKGYAGDMLTARAMVDRIFPGEGGGEGGGRPLLIGPDENPRPDWLQT